MNSIRYYRNLLTATIDENNYYDVSDTFIVNSVGYENRNDYFTTYKPHGRHDNYLLYMQEGEILVEKEDKSQIKISQGQGIFFEAEHLINYKALKTPVIYYFVHFTGSAVENEIKRFGLYHEFVFDIGISKTIIHLFHKMFEEFNMRFADFSYNCSVFTLQILVQIKRSLLKEFNPYTTRINHSITYINDNYNIDISIEQLAEIEGICISRYRDLFTKQMGISPVQYITHLRISNACDLLKGSTFSISEISQKCGYDDVSYFYRVFKKTTGLTPKQYRAIS